MDPLNNILGLPYTFPLCLESINFLRDTTGSAEIWTDPGHHPPIAAQRSLQRIE